MTQQQRVLNRYLYEDVGHPYFNILHLRRNALFDLRVTGGRSVLHHSGACVREWEVWELWCRRVRSGRRRMSSRASLGLGRLAAQGAHATRPSCYEMAPALRGW